MDQDRGHLARAGESVLPAVAAAAPRPPRDVAPAAPREPAGAVLLLRLPGPTGPPRRDRAAGLAPAGRAGRRRRRVHRSVGPGGRTLERDRRGPPGRLGGRRPGGAESGIRGGRPRARAGRAHLSGRSRPRRVPGDRRWRTAPATPGAAAARSGGPAPAVRADVDSRTRRRPVPPRLVPPAVGGRSGFLRRWHGAPAADRPAVVDGRRGVPARASGRAGLVLRLPRRRRRGAAGSHRLAARSAARSRPGRRSCSTATLVPARRGAWVADRWWGARRRPTAPRPGHGRPGRRVAGSCRQRRDGLDHWIPSGVPLQRLEPGDRLDRRRLRQPGLVRPADLDEHRRRRRPVRAVVRRDGARRDPVAARQRHLLRHRPAGARPAAPADRGGQGAAGPAAQRASDQSIPGRALGGARLDRRGRHAEPPVVPIGGRTAGAGVGSGPGTAARAPCRTAPVPAGRLSVAGLPLGAPDRWRARRRHGSGEDSPDAGRDLPGEGAGSARPACPGRRPDQRGRELGGRSGQVRSRPARRHRSTRLRPAATPASANGSPERTWW